MRGTTLAVALVVLTGCAATPVEPSRPVATTGPLAVIVVPFDASGLPLEQRWIGDGIAEVVSLGIVQHPAIVQIDRARVTVVSNPEVWTEETVRKAAREVRADAALYGRVRRDADGLVVEPRLLNPRSGKVEALPDLHAPDLEFLLRVTMLPVLFARELRPAATEAVSPHMAKAAHPTDSMRAFELFIRGRTAFYRRDPEAALDPLARATTADHRQFPVAQYALGMAHVALGSRWKAAAQFRAAMLLDSSYPEPHKALGDLFLASPRQLVEPAIEAYSKAIQLRFFYADAYVGLGDARTAKGDADGALAAYEKALTFDPFKAGTHVKRGKILASRGFCNAAESEYERARELDPRSPDVRCAE